MINWVRKVVAGPKNTLSHKGGNLDLTYITPRIIAMAFPADTMIEKTYRNDIQDVAAYLDETHPDDYLIINVSSRNYNSQPFKGRVLEFQWADHQTPTLTTLVDVGYQIWHFLSQKESRVVAVHCNHGKGRTGTAIIALLLLVGYFTCADSCRTFYNKKRFNKLGYGVDQPCQVRYLRYLQALLKEKTVSKQLPAYRLKKITHKGLGPHYFIKITSVRDQKVLFEKIPLQFNTPLPGHLLMTDLFIELNNDHWRSKKVARINCNLYFLDQSLTMSFKSQAIKVSESVNLPPFEFTLHFEYHCLCHLPVYSETICTCNYKRAIEECFWKKMIKQLEESKQISSIERKLIIEGRDFQTFNDGRDSWEEEDQQEIRRGNRLTALLAPQEKTVKGRRQSKLLIKYTQNKDIWVKQPKVEPRMVQGLMEIREQEESHWKFDNKPSSPIQVPIAIIQKTTEDDQMPKTTAKHESQVHGTMEVLPNVERASQRSASKARQVLDAFMSEEAMPRHVKDSYSVGNMQKQRRILTEFMNEGRTQEEATKPIDLQRSEQVQNFASKNPSGQQKSKQRKILEEFMEDDIDIRQMASRQTKSLQILSKPRMILEQFMNDANPKK